MTGGIGALEQAILDLALANLNDCGRPTPDLVLRYHGDPVVECCDMLTIFWRLAKPDRTGLVQGSGRPPGRGRVDLYLRLYRCFPTLGEDGRFDGDADGAAEGLALDADCLWNGLYDAICAGTLGANLAGCDEIILVDMTPRPPKGGCAGIELHLNAAWLRWAA